MLAGETTQTVVIYNSFIHVITRLWCNVKNKTGLQYNIRCLYNAVVLVSVLSDSFIGMMQS